MSRELQLFRENATVWASPQTPLHHRCVCPAFMRGNACAGVSLQQMTTNWESQRSTRTFQLLCCCCCCCCCCSTCRLMSEDGSYSAFVPYISLGFKTASYFSFMTWNWIFSEFRHHGLQRRGRYCRMRCGDMVALGVRELLDCWRRAAGRVRRAARSKCPLSCRSRPVWWGRRCCVRTRAGQLATVSSPPAVFQAFPPSFSRSIAVLLSQTSLWFWFVDTQLQ